MDLSNAKGETIGHLGLVASIMKEVGLMEKIDEQLGKVEGGLSYGIRVGGMSHLDSTTLTLYGSYEHFTDQEGVPSPKFGYSKLIFRTIEANFFDLR